METGNIKDENLFSKKIGEKEKRKLKAQREKKRSAWMGLAVIGMIGWSVAVPTLLGVALGMWIDKCYPEHRNHLWTLNLLVIGLIIGCILAWQWINKEDKAMHKNNEEEK